MTHAHLRLMLAMSGLAFVASAAPIVAQSPVDSIRSLDREGRRQLAATRSDSAVATFRAAQVIARRLANADLEAMTTFDLARAFAELPQSDSALANFRRVLAYGDGQDAVALRASVLHRIALVHVGTDALDSARVYDQLALPLSRRARLRELEASILVNLAVTFSRIDVSDSAIVYYREALPIVREVHDSAGMMATLNGLSRNLERTGHPDSALALARESVAISRASTDTTRRVLSLTLYGVLLLDLGQMDSAMVAYRSALALNRSRGNRDGEAQSLAAVGTVFERSSVADSALAYYRAAYRLTLELGDAVGKATMLRHIGTVYGFLDQSDSARAYLTLALIEHRKGGQRARIAGALRDLAHAYSGELARALPLLRESLAIERLRRNVITEAATLDLIGQAFRTEGRRDSALVYFNAELALRRAHQSAGLEATALSNIGLIHFTEHRPDSALAYLMRARALQGAGTTSFSLAVALNNIGYVYHALGRDTEARAVLDSSAALRARMRVHAGDDESTVTFAENAIGTNNEWTRAWLNPSLDPRIATPSALAVAERGRAQGLRELLRRSTRATGDEQWSSDTLPGADLVAEANRELEPLRRAHAAMLYYFVSNDTIATWLLTTGGELRPVQVARRARIDGLLTWLRRGIGADDARTRMARGAVIDQEALVSDSSASNATRGVDDDVRKTYVRRLDDVARQLARILVPGDLATLVPAGAELVIVPHGNVGLVPFAALPVHGDTTPLGARYAIRYAPSLRALGIADAAAPVAARTYANRALVVGDPTMPTTRGVNGQSVHLRQLPSARIEGDSIAARFKVPLLTGDAATETAVRGALPAASVVHLATHGLAFGNAARVRRSYVALAPDGRNDGLLTIGELLDEVPSLSADLVVLSACQTGLGNLQQAEGTVGFQRALLAKGARSVLVSLWSVDDEATALLMQRFYAHWLGNDARPARGKAEALRLAQGDVRAVSRFASPKYWAAFQLVGAR